MSLRKPRGSKTTLPIPAIDVSQGQKLEILNIMMQNILYALGEEVDVDTRNKINLELVEKLNALEGAKKDLIQWKAVWENMCRYCNENNPSEYEFINLIAAYKAIPKRNTVQRTMISNKILKYVNDLRSKSVERVKREFKKESNSNITVVDLDEEDNKNFSQITKREPESTFQPMVQVPVPSTSRSHVMPHRQIKTETNSLQTVAHGDKVDIDVLKSIVESIVGREIQINMPSLVRNAVTSIISSPEFEKKMKVLFNNDIEQLAQKLYLQWSMDQRQNDRNLESNDSREALQDLSNHPQLNLRKEESPRLSFGYYDDSDLENLSPRKENDTLQVEDSEIQNAEGISIEEYDDNDFENTILKASSASTKRNLPYEFDLKDVEEFDRPTKSSLVKPPSPRPNFFKYGARKENPPKLRAVYGVKR